MADAERRQRGQEIRRGAFGEDGEERWQTLSSYDAGHAESILEYCFGTVWARPGLELKWRHLIVIAAAAAQDLSGEVAIHTRGALNRGATREEIIETIVQCSPYIGFPKTNHALEAANRVINEWDNHPEWHA
jgi:4-carboxymuconolactone decarboxylase